MQPLVRFSQKIERGRAEAEQHRQPAEQGGKRRLAPVNAAR